jgi:hypothetical protein
MVAVVGERVATEDWRRFKTKVALEVIAHPTLRIPIHSGHRSEMKPAT